MNRREFTRNMMAAMAAPALPLPALAKAQAVAVPKAARFWAIYMTHLHGDVTPGMLTQMTGIDPVQTTAIRAKLIADKVIAPVGFMEKSIAVQTIARSEAQTKSTLAKIKSQTEQTREAAKELVDKASEALHREDAPEAADEPIATSFPDPKAAPSPEEPDNSPT